MLQETAIGRAHNFILIYPETAMHEIRIPETTLNDGRTMPALGLGTYKLNGSAGVEALVRGIDAGYRLLDSAFNYENEGALGQAVRRAGVDREELFLVSKLPGRHQRREEALRTVEESLYRAGLDYWDLYLIHWPNPKQGLFVEAWRALLEARERGLIRSAGVCNFLPVHLDALVRETGTPPAVNQVELHPYFSQKEQVAFDRRHGIVTQAWSPLARTNNVLKEKALREIAEVTGKTVSQVVLRWHVQSGTVPLPKSASPERQAENLDVFNFELCDADMAAIDALTRPDGRLKGQDPAVYEEF
ncbi:2,5-diketo-D-gluconic acid reductase B [Pseudodesulfovibrio hydrargyri]|uniref:2,5-diketo-D-gluconic acid reductase B n=1 Tax=Pseudodesulfovibrio hydrargyri TaxID=2125990 RepID=A0A1J5NAV6_9BACT|nr:aldo/keto reductase [Pseudodesulfovibrio hydrargyri]OIQ51960.1 2,5-diketo-D-gluconic acid reductase B [Pseudodesulfovibrio hydrargyri]